MQKATAKDETGGQTPMAKRMEDECAKKEFLRYAKSWLQRAAFGKSIGRSKDESDDRLGEKSYAGNTRGAPVEMRKCEI